MSLRIKYFVTQYYNFHKSIFIKKKKQTFLERVSTELKFCNDFYKSFVQNTKFFTNSTFFFILVKKFIDRKNMSIAGARNLTKCLTVIVIRWFFIIKVLVQMRCKSKQCTLHHITKLWSRESDAHARASSFLPIHLYLCRVASGYGVFEKISCIHKSFVLLWTFKIRVI